MFLWTSAIVNNVDLKKNIKGKIQNLLLKENPNLLKKEYQLRMGQEQLKEVLLWIDYALIKHKKHV